MLELIKDVTRYEALYSSPWEVAIVSELLQEVQGVYDVRRQLQRLIPAAYIYISSIRKGSCTINSSITMHKQELIIRRRRDYQTVKVDTTFCTMM